MKKIVMFAAVAGAALTLAACQGEAEAPVAETEAPQDDTAAALDAAAEAAEGTEVNGNPIGPSAPSAEGNPIGPSAEAVAE